MTIYALSSGPGVSGIAVIRVSGKNTKEVIKKLTGSKLPTPRVATLTKFNKNGAKKLIDEGVVGDIVFVSAGKGGAPLSGWLADPRAGAGPGLLRRC